MTKAKKDCGLKYLLSYEAVSKDSDECDGLTPVEASGGARGTLSAYGKLLIGTPADRQSNDHISMGRRPVYLSRRGLSCRDGSRCS
jgi:hypothetical protein